MFNIHKKSVLFLYALGINCYVLTMKIAISLPIFSDLVTIQNHAKNKKFTLNTEWFLEHELKVLSISDFTGLVNVYTNIDNADNLFFKDVSPGQQLKIKQALSSVYLYMLDVDVELTDKSSNVSFKRMIAGFLALPLINFYEQKSKNVAADLSELFINLNKEISTLSQKVVDLANPLNQRISDLSAHKNNLDNQINDTYKPQIQNLYRIIMGGGVVIFGLSMIILYLTLYKK